MKQMKMRWTVLLFFLILLSGCVFEKQDGKDVGVANPDGNSVSTEDSFPNESDGDYYYTERLLTDRKEQWGLSLVKWRGKVCVLQNGETKDGRSTLRLKDMESNRTMWEHILNGGEKYSLRLAVWGDEILLGIHDNGKNPRMRRIDVEGKTVREVNITEKSLIPREKDASEGGSYFGWEGVGADSEYFYFWYCTSERKVYLTVYRQDGSFVREEDVALNAKLFFDGSGNYYVWTDFLEKRDVATGMRLYSVPAEFGYDGWMDTERGRLYLLDKDEMDLIAYRTADGKRLGVEFRFGEDASFIPEGDMRILDGTVGKNGFYFVSSRIYFQPSTIVYEDFSVHFYERVSGVRRPREKTLSVLVPYETTAMRRAKKRFEIRHPDIQVKMEAAYPEKEEYLANAWDYETELRKNLAAGKAGDVVEYGIQADFRELCKDETFADLLPYVRKSEVKEEWNETWLGLCECSGALRVLPSEAAVGYLVFYPALAERLDFHDEPSDCRWSTLLEAMKRSKERKAGVFTDDPSLFTVLQEIVRANLPDLVKEEEKVVSLREEWFRTLLQELKEVKEEVIGSEMSKNPGNETDRHGEVLFGVETGGEDWWNRLLWVMGVSQKEKRKIVPCFAGERHANRSVRFVKRWGIPSSAQNPDAGWDFLEELMSAEVQEQCEGIPVNMETLSKRLSRIQRWGFSSETAKQYEDEFMKIVTEAKESEENGKVLQAVTNPLFEYLQGSLNLDEALNKAENDVRIILKE